MKYRMAMTLMMMGAMMTSVAAVAEDVVAKSAKEATPLKVGAMIPDVAVLDTDGKEVNLREMVAKQPTAFIFYRGGWCPYCNKHLKEMGKRAKDLQKAGYQIAAIAPETPANLAETGEKQRLDYAMLADPELKAISGFGLSFRLDGETLKKYEGYGIDLAARSGGANEDVLPVPALFLVNAKGKVVFAHSDPDYKKRVDVDKVIAAAKKSMKEGS